MPIGGGSGGNIPPLRGGHPRWLTKDIPDQGYDYTWRIAVGIPKTAMGVTAILPTAMAVTAMTAI